MIAIFSSVIVVCLITWVYFRWVNVRQFWKRRGVSHLPPHPILGSLTFLQRKNPATWMIEMYQKFNTPYVGIWLFWRPALIINSPEIAKNVLVKDFEFFRDRFLSSGSSDPVGGLNLFTTNDPLWSSLRRRLTSVFTSSKLKAMQPLIDTKTFELVERIRSTENKTKISLRYLFTDFTTDIFATAAFGIKTNATLTGEDPMRTVTKAFMEFDMYRGLNWISIFFFPKLVDIFRFSFFPKSSTDYFTRVFNIVSQKRASNRNTESKDFLDVLLKMKEEGANNGEAISDHIIIAQAAIFLFGGFETSGSILSFATYELAFNQDVQEKLYNELKEVQMQSKDGRLEIIKLSELPYINAVTKETLRKYVPMGWLDRVAALDYKVDDNLTIPAGTPIYVNAIGMQHDSKIYPDPDTFNPDRFLPENEKNIKPYTYLPFGDGPRSCIGKRFGQISVRHGIANLILNYKLVPLPGAPKPNEVEFDKRGLFLVPGQHLHYLFTDFTTDIFATAAFGIKTNATLTGEDPMRTVTKAFMEFDMYRGLNWISIFFFPKLVDIFRFSFFPKSSTDYFTRVFNIVSQKRASNRNTESKDFLDVLLKMKEEGANNGEAISDHIIIAQAAIFLFGGFETSGSILSFATYELAFNQDVQEKLYNELKEVQMQSKDGRLEIIKLSELPYINAVTKETLRKYVPMGWLDRVAALDYKVDDNLTIPAGTPIYVNAIGMQHDSKIYPDPDTFNPDRFLPENEKNIKPYTYLPFGDGPRSCIGKRFGQISVRHGIANLILNYKLVPLPGAPKPNEVEFDKRGLFLVPGQHLHVNFVSRNQD